MINTLNYSVTFANERQIKRDLQFELQGSTLITGRNEAGKSLNLEMIAYSLFGNDALRGKMTDYKRISCKASFIIKGQNYVIERTKTNAKLFKAVEGEDLEPLATGISPVNKAIVELLGFDFDVYRIAHLAAQGDLQALANMKPTERKRMVDTVAGLNQLDDVAAELDGERKELRGKITGMEAVLTEPEQPLSPTTNREELTKTSALLDVKVSERQKLKTVKAPTAPTLLNRMSLMDMPEEPEALVLPDAPVAPAEPAEWSEETFSQLLAMKPQIAAADAAIQKAEAVVAPALTKAQIDEQRELNRLNKRIAERDALRGQGYLICSDCGHKNYLAANLLEEKYSDVPEVSPAPSTYSEAELIVMETQLAEKERVDAEAEAARAQLANLNPLRQVIIDWEAYAAELRTYRQAEQHWQQRCDDLKASHDRLMTQYHTGVERVKAHNLEAESHNQNVEAHNARAQDNYQTELAAYQQAQEALASYEGLDTEIAQVTNSLRMWEVYDARFEAYEHNMATYKAQLAEVETLKEQLADLDKARKALNETKTNVKSYLTPALSRVASILLSEMTGGERNTVVVDEDFEVTVDNQPLRTLSGSGKDIANLAIRLALGQVLTHSVLPMVCLDEVDQGCDSERARYIQECLQRITPQIGQMLIVSHKPTVADHTIAL